MKAIGGFLFLIFILSGLVRAEPTVLKLNDGSVIKGEVTPPSPTATEVVVSTEIDREWPFGPTVRFRHLLKGSLIEFA